MVLGFFAEDTSGGEADGDPEEPMWMQTRNRKQYRQFSR